MAHERLPNNWHVSVLFVHRADDLPIDLGQIRRHASINFAVKKLHDLRSALTPPDFGRRHRFAVVQNKRIGDLWIDICLRLVVIRGVGRTGIAVGAWTQFFDAERVQLPPMLFF